MKGLNASIQERAYEAKPMKTDVKTSICFFIALIQTANLVQLLHFKRTWIILAVLLK